MKQEWSVDLPNWKRQPDPEIAGQAVWVHLNYDGDPDLALALNEEGRPEVSVLSPVVFTEDEVDGESLGSFSDWDAALEFALKALEER